MVEKIENLLLEERFIEKEAKEGRFLTVSQTTAAAALNSQISGGASFESPKVDRYYAFEIGESVCLSVCLTVCLSVCLLFLRCRLHKLNKNGVVTLCLTWIGRAGQAGQAND